MNPDSRIGHFDATDLGVGIVLLVVIPALVYFVGALFIEDPFVASMGQKASVDAPPDQEEVNLYLVEASNLLRINAREYLRLMNKTTNGALRDKYRQWTQRALDEGLNKLKEVEFLIEEHPAGRGAFSSVIQKIAQLRIKGTVEFQRIKELDILGGS